MSEDDFKEGVWNHMGPVPDRPRFVPVAWWVYQRTLLTLLGMVRYKDLIQWESDGESFSMFRDGVVPPDFEEEKDVPFVEPDKKIERAMINLNEYIYSADRKAARCKPSEHDFGSMAKAYYHGESSFLAEPPDVFDPESRKAYNYVFERDPEDNVHNFPPSLPPATPRKGNPDPFLPGHFLKPFGSLQELREKLQNTLEHRLDIYNPKAISKVLDFVLSLIPDIEEILQKEREHYARICSDLEGYVEKQTGKIILEAFMRGDEKVLDDLQRDFRTFQQAKDYGGVIDPCKFALACFMFEELQSGGREFFLIPELEAVLESKGMVMHRNSISKFLDEMGIPKAPRGMPKGGMKRKL